MRIFALCKKCLFSILLEDLDEFDLIIFENLDKSLEYVCNEIPIQQNKVHVWYPFQKEPTPETYSWYFSLHYNELIVFLPF